MNTYEFSDQFYEYLTLLFEVNSRDISDLYFKKNKSNCNIVLKNDILMQFKKPYEILLRSSSFSVIEKYSIPYLKSKKKYDTIPFKISVERFSFINENAEFLLELFDELYLKGNPDAFSFCSKWQQCADELSCVETDKTQAALCRSRKNIASGLVFNGKNSVLDKNGQISQEKVRLNLSKMPTSKVITINLNIEAEQITL